MFVGRFVGGVDKMLMVCYNEGMVLLMNFGFVLCVGIEWAGKCDIKCGIVL